ncbi:hypothetical protein QWY85_02565 [Neolewinella lacunae]|uniref:Lipoprotein n=1 Tax=Neolewinella lacunae TaxID=1517758 RepID=A0A923PK27_9BACT|nr:hypothetical protein [Neolewinella lacunae]MBC6992643.1 hypothetical protein [Neolewinella lacunae]MDN3633523.1 hypothetical protein [Neolewinella lacunae]
MKQSKVYLFSLLLFVGIPLISTGCARKSGCAAIQSTVRQDLRKDGTPKQKSSSSLFDKKTTRKMGRGR